MITAEMAQCFEIGEIGVEGTHIVQRQSKSIVRVGTKDWAENAITFDRGWFKVKITNRSSLAECMSTIRKGPSMQP